jgi:hypothetical protein
MDREPDEMRSLGVVGICKEAYNILQLHVRLFLSLALTLVLPLGVIIFCHGFVSDPLVNKINRNENELTMEGIGSPAAAQTHSRLDAEYFGLFIFGLTYLIFVLAFSLLSTAAIVYTVASIYTAKGLSYVKVLSVVPKVWKRLFMTFLWAHILIFLYNVAFIFILFLILLLQFSTGLNFGILAIPVIFVFYCLAIYIYLVWHLASVVSVLEDSYGIAALRKSAELIKGKRWVACAVFLIYTVLTSIVLTIYNVLVRDPNHMQSVAGRVFIGLLLLLLWTAFTLIGILVQTVVYFVCKSYHHESIDRYALSEHLDGYLGEYMPLKGPVSLEALEAELEEV